MTRQLEIDAISRVNSKTGQIENPIFKGHQLTYKAVNLLKSTLEITLFFNLRCEIHR
jgi:hypothetical protein